MPIAQSVIDAPEQIPPSLAVTAFEVDEDGPNDSLKGEPVLEKLPLEHPFNEAVRIYLNRLKLLLWVVTANLCLLIVIFLLILLLKVTGRRPETAPALILFAVVMLFPFAIKYISGILYRMERTSAERDEQHAKLIAQ